MRHEPGVLGSAGIHKHHPGNKAQPQSTLLQLRFLSLEGLADLFGDSAAEVSDFYVCGDRKESINDPVFRVLVSQAILSMLFKMPCYLESLSNLRCTYVIRDNSAPYINGSMPTPSSTGS
jgi:hypothetical protein